MPPHKPKAYLSTAVSLLKLYGFIGLSPRAETLSAQALEVLTLRRLTGWAVQGPRVDASPVQGREQV